MAEYPLLNSIDNPEHLRDLAPEQLPVLAAEMRAHLIDSLNQCGGHFAANLGAIELAIALHTVFNTPYDRLVWDVGHQAYPHKVLTGRRDQLNTIKQPNGLAPFPKRGESEYDTFGVGHSSTSISAAVGMAMAAKCKGEQRQAVAIIGDGGLTGGMAFEALNHAGSIDANVLVVLNDNEMSISPNVGALTNYLARLLSGKMYNSMRESSKKVLSMVPPVKTLAKRTETHIKGMITPGTLFEELGFNYIGPVDGHDLETLIPTLENVKNLKGPRLLHVVSRKGKGYPPAEADPVKYHAVSPGFTQATQPSTTSQPKPPTYSQIFGDWLCHTAALEPDLVGITPAMREGSGMVRFHQEYPEQYVDVGIAEQHSVTVAAGMACEGLKPVVAIYSTFLQRAYDQLIHDVAIQNLDVTFAIDRAGLVGSDGPTHAGSFDLSYLRCIPNMVIMAPSSEEECWHMLNTAYYHEGPAAVRYPRGTGNGTPIEDKSKTLPLGKGEILHQGKHTLLLAFGSLVPAALDAGKTLNATVVNMRFIKPLDRELLASLAQTHDHIVTIEENAIMGGAGSAVAELLSELGIIKPIQHLGLPDTFIEHGKPEHMLAECGLNHPGIVQSVQSFQDRLDACASTHAKQRNTVESQL